MFQLVLIITVVFKALYVSGHCIDIHSQVVSQGLHYVPGPNTCTLCICDKGSPKWCKSVLCSPPQNCKSFQVGNSCCEFKCLDDILTANDGYKENYDLALRLIASAITAVLSLSLLFFLFHRLRRRKGRTHQNRQLNEDQRSLNSIGYITGNLGYISGNIGYLGSGNGELEFHYEETSAHYSLWKPTGNYFPRGEAPPPYEEAVRTGQIENGINNTQISVVNANTVNISSCPSQSVQVNVNQQQPQLAQCIHENLCNNQEYANINLPNLTLCSTNDISSKNDHNIPAVGDMCLENEFNHVINKSQKQQMGRNEKSRSYENIIETQESECPATSSGFRKNKLGTNSDYEHLAIDKNQHKYNRYENVVFKNANLLKDVYNVKKLDKTNNFERPVQIDGGCNSSDMSNIENVRHRAIGSLTQYQGAKDQLIFMKTCKSKDSIHTVTDTSAKRQDSSKTKFVQEPDSNLKNLISFKDKKDMPLHRTLPKNLRELSIPYISNNKNEYISNDSFKKNDISSLSHRSLPKHLSCYDTSLSLNFMKSHINLLDNTLQKSNDNLNCSGPSVRLSIVEIKNQDRNRSIDKDDERTFISYQCLSSSQDEDDYRSECENCKSSGFVSLDETDVLNETMTLQRRPLESGEDIPYYRTSLTLPTHTKKPRTVTPNPVRESWFVSMRESSSSDESN